MIRFFGMMPANEVEITKRYYDCDNCHIATIQAGYHGWTLLYADLSSQYNDMDDTPENNFQAALNVFKEDWSYKNVVEKGERI